MRMNIDHPSNPRMMAVVGWDHLLGFFAEICHRGCRLYQYDNLVCDDGPTSLHGVLSLLVNQEFFSNFDVGEAHRALGYVDDIEDIDEPAVKTVAEVIERLKEAASR